MPFDLKKLTQFDFCVLVLWLHGVSIGQIAKTVGRKYGRTAAAIRGITTKKLQVKRAAMTREDRQLCLDFLKANRIDDGAMADTMFVAVTIKSNIKVVGPNSMYRKEKPADHVPEEIDLSSMSKTERKAYKRNKDREKILEAQREADAIAKRQEGHATARGVSATPLEFLDSKGLLADAGENLRGAIVKTSNEMRRLHAGVYLRNIFERRDSSGLKTQNYESVGGSGGAGPGISASIVEAISISSAIEQMMMVEDWRTIVRLLSFGDFIWEVKSDVAGKKILEDIRRALDCVAVYMNYQITPIEFQERWGFMPIRQTAATRRQVRNSTETAREIIEKAQRAMK